VIQLFGLVMSFETKLNLIMESIHIGANHGCQDQIDANQTASRVASVIFVRYLSPSLEKAAQDLPRQEAKALSYR
jgi:hypothetical protein